MPTIVLAPPPLAREGDGSQETVDGRQQTGGEYRLPQTSRGACPPGAVPPCVTTGGEEFTATRRHEELPGRIQNRKHKIRNPKWPRLSARSCLREFHAPAQRAAGTLTRGRQAPAYPAIAQNNRGPQFSRTIFAERNSHRQEHRRRQRRTRGAKPRSAFGGSASRPKSHSFVLSVSVCVPVCGCLAFPLRLSPRSPRLKPLLFSSCRRLRSRIQNRQSKIIPGYACAPWLVDPLFRGFSPCRVPAAGSAPRRRSPGCSWPRSSPRPAAAAAAS